MEREGSLPCANEPSAFSCTEKDEQDRVLFSLKLFDNYFNIISHLRLRPSSVLLHVVLPRHKTCI